VQILISITILLLSTISSHSEEKLTLQFFGSNTCGECLEIKEELLFPAQKQFRDRLQINFYNTDIDSTINQLIRLEQIYGVKNSSAQMLFFPDTFLSGADDIMKFGLPMIKIRIDENRAGAGPTVDTDGEPTDALRNKVMDWGFFVGSLVAGLTDGINPCAIATMIFLISFLATRKKSRREVLTIGLAYTATVFFTYFAMGLGLKGILEHIRAYHQISTTIRWGAFGFALLIAALSFRDAFVYHKTRRSEKISLQLPKSVKLQIHKVISGSLSGKGIIIGSIIAGFLVTLLEAICTGQMYLPYIVAMTQRDSLRITGYLYLLFYNFLFVLPLLIVMVLAFFGLKWNDLAKSTGKHMVALKTTLGLVMVGLALYLASGIL
jgi:cytochrome c biogenesis protein CcdA